MQATFAVSISPAIKSSQQEGGPTDGRSATFEARFEYWVLPAAASLVPCRFHNKPNLDYPRLRFIAIHYGRERLRRRSVERDRDPFQAAFRVCHELYALNSLCVWPQTLPNRDHPETTGVSKNGKARR